MAVRAGFGKRRYKPVSPRGRGNAGIGASDYLGMSLLGLLVMLVIAVQFYGTQTGHAFVATICRALDLPMGFAETGWDLRLSTALPVVTGATSASGLSIRSFLVFAHQASLILGLGSALFLDLYLARFLVHRRINQHTLETARFGSSIVAFGLTAIWATGIAILALYAWTDPQLLENPKIWGKLYIVAALTVNGFYIHRHVLPKLQYSLGRRVLDGEFKEIASNLLPVVAISSVSWAAAFVLGAFSELNGMISAFTIICAYWAAVGAVYLALASVCWFAARVRDEVSEPSGSVSRQSRLQDQPFTSA